MRWSRSRRSVGQAAKGEVAKAPARLPAGMSVPTSRGESVLTAAQEDVGSRWVVLTTYRVVVVSSAGEVQVERPWHEVATGAWDPESATLSLTWIGSTRAVQWQFGSRTGPGRIPEVFRERVSASVVQVREVDVGDRQTARISIRSVLDTRELIDQVVLGRGAGSADPQLAREVERVRAEVRAAVGLSPQALSGP